MSEEDYTDLIESGRVTPTVAARMETNANTRARRRRREKAITELCPCNSCRSIRGEPLIELPTLNIISRPMQRRAKSRKRYNPPPP